VAGRICEHEQRLVRVIGPIKQNFRAEGFRSHPLPV
jgi:hypothetical protein